MSRMGRAALASLRTWWKELAYLALSALFIPAAHGWVLTLAMDLPGAICWALGFAHRHQPVFDVIRKMDAKLDQALGDDKPPAKVRRLHSV